MILLMLEGTLESLINVLHAYLFLRDFSFQHALIQTNTFTNFWKNFLQTHYCERLKLQKYVIKALSLTFFTLKYEI